MSSPSSKSNVKTISSNKISLEQEQYIHETAKLLHGAIRCRDLAKVMSIVDSIISHGANVSAVLNYHDIKFYHCTTLHISVRNWSLIPSDEPPGSDCFHPNTIPILEFLIGNGAALTLKNDLVHTPLEEALDSDNDNDDSPAPEVVPVLMTFLPTKL